MARLLAISTATRCTGVAVIENDCLLGELSLRAPRTHTDLLLSSLQQLLVSIELELEDIDAFVAVTGPGAFTGLRVGVATVKGLATALDKPVVPVSSLATLAAQAETLDLPICAMLDARKGEVYACRYRRNAGAVVPLTDEAVMAPERLLATIDEETLFVGNGARLYRELVEERLGVQARVAPSYFDEPRAAVAAALAAPLWAAGRAVPAVQVMPVYIRRSEAEIMWAKKHAAPVDGI